MKLRLVSSRRLAAALVAISLTLTLASDGLASSREAGERGKYRGQCRRLTLQIDHFQGTILPMAVERGNRGWEQATSAQIERLWHRRADLCPAYGAQRTRLAKAADQMRKFNALVKAAGQAALTYFTGGMSGGVLP